MDDSDAQSGMIEVEVAFALPQEQRIIALQVPHGTSALQAVEQSGILHIFPMIDLQSASLGIFSTLLDGKSRPLPQDYVLQPRDRVEIYRPLQIDPKLARQQRVIKERKDARRLKQAQRAAR